MQNSLNGIKWRVGIDMQLPAKSLAYAPAPMNHPLYVTVIGQLQKPSLIVPVNVIVTIPVAGSCEHDPVGTPTILFNDQFGNIST
jgi:hypothetical protein